MTDQPDQPLDGHDDDRERVGRLTVVLARLIHMADNPDTYSDLDIRDAIGRIAGSERSHPSIAYALQQYQAALEEDRRIERARRML